MPLARASKERGNQRLAPRSGVYRAMTAQPHTRLSGIVCVYQGQSDPSQRGRYSAILCPSLDSTDRE
jgi:hypothetical protein